MNKAIVILLAVLLLILQYKLWFADGSVRDTLHLKKQIAEQQLLGSQLQERNAKIASNIKVLKESNGAIESSARKDLGMIKNGEMFYQTSVGSQVKE
jgi:cell division protein FtsB